MSEAGGSPSAAGQGLGKGTGHCGTVLLVSQPGWMLGVMSSAPSNPAACDQHVRRGLGLPEQGNTGWSEGQGLTSAWSHP